MIKQWMLATWALVGLALPGQARPPNILYIMADDHATNAISAYGSHLTSVFKTPHIDRLAKEGIRMDRTYRVNAICTASSWSMVIGAREPLGLIDAPMGRPTNRRSSILSLNCLR